MPGLKKSFKIHPRTHSRKFLQHPECAPAERRQSRDAFRVYIQNASVCAVKNSPQFLSARPSTCPRFRPEKGKVRAIHSPQFLSARPSTCPRFRPEKQKSAVHSPQFLSARPGTCPKFFGFFFALKKKRPARPSFQSIN